MTFSEVIPFLIKGKIARRVQRDWIYNYERIKLNYDTIELYNKWGYVTNLILWQDDLEADDWEVLEDDTNDRE